MGKYQKENQTKKKNGGIVIALILVIALAVGVCFVLPGLRADTPGADDTTTPTETESASQATETTDTEPVTTEPTVPTVQFPLALEDGKLEVESLFQFSGINPDCANQEGTDVASIVVKNTSDTYLAEANISMTLIDGTQLNFAVTDLPAGKRSMAFSLENTSIAADAGCTEVICDAVFDSEAGMQSDRVAVSVDGVVISLTNTTDEKMTEIDVYCHSPFNEEYFGGITYKYTINDLPAGETATVEAWDCILGFAEVVRVEIK